MHCSLVLETEANAKHEYWQGVDEHNSDLWEKIPPTAHETNSMENVKRSFEVFREQVDSSYDKYYDVLEQNRKETQRKNRKQSKHRYFKRRTMTKFINEWILFVFILHCLFAGALLDHIGTHLNI